MTIKVLAVPGKTIVKRSFYFEYYRFYVKYLKKYRENNWKV